MNPSPCSLSASRAASMTSPTLAARRVEEDAELIAAEAVGGAAGTVTPGSRPPSLRSSASPAGWPKLSL